ncbi:MAG: restriction endonuclease subunit S [Caenibius sp.]
MSSDVAELVRPVDAVPVDWRQTTLGGALAKSEGGGTPPRDVAAYWNGDIPWASVKDVVKGEGSTPEETITPTGLANSTSKLIPAGTNIFAARMGVGAVVRYPFPVAINQD